MTASPNEQSNPRRIYCGPDVGTPLVRTTAEFDKYRGVAMLEGEYCHTTLPYKVKASREFMQDLADKWNAHRQHIEIPTPEGHTLEAAKNRGYLDQGAEAKVVELEINGEKRAALELPFDIRDAETRRAAAAGTLGRSVGLEEDFRYSTPDGQVHKIGTFLNHVAWTSYPVITNMPPLQPTREFSKEGQLIEFVPLASRMITYQDPPRDVVQGLRKATHDECGYTAGTPEQNCRLCLAYVSGGIAGDGSRVPPSCFWVSSPILDPNVCKYFRRDRSFARDVSSGSDDSGVSPGDVGEDGLPENYSDMLASAK